MQYNEILKGQIPSLRIIYIFSIKEKKEKYHSLEESKNKEKIITHHQGIQNINYSNFIFRKKPTHNIQ